jgi:hypothetical protein
MVGAGGGRGPKFLRSQKVFRSIVPDPVADIYMFDRIFRHFYFRDIANELAAAKTSDDAKAIFLDETEAWSDSYFTAGTAKSNWQLMFFEKPTSTFADNAAEQIEAAKTNKQKPVVRKTLARKEATKTRLKGSSHR